jgi:hypothetical protein
MGALFRDIGADMLELTLNERLWLYICLVVSELDEIFGLDEEKVMSKLIAENQAFTETINLKSLLHKG